MPKISMKDWEGSVEDERADRAAVKAINSGKGNPMKKHNEHLSELEHEAESHHDKHHAKNAERHAKEHMHEHAKHHAALRSRYKG